MPPFKGELRPPKINIWLPITQAECAYRFYGGGSITLSPKLERLLFTVL